MGAHDEDGSELDFAGVRAWFGEYLGEPLTCTVRAPSAELVDSSSLWFAGVAQELADAPPESDHLIRVGVGENRIDLLDLDFMEAQARYSGDVDVHSLYVRCQGFALLVSAGAPPES